MHFCNRECDQARTTKSILVKAIKLRRRSSHSQDAMNSAPRNCDEDITESCEMSPLYLGRILCESLGKSMSDVVHMGNFKS